MKRTEKKKYIKGEERRRAKAVFKTVSNPGPTIGACD